MYFLLLNFVSLRGIKLINGLARDLSTCHPLDSITCRTILCHNSMSSLFEQHKISTCRRPLHLLIPYLLCRLSISPHGACSNESLNSWRCSNLFEFLNSFKVQNVSHSCHNHSRTVAIISLDYKNKKSEDYTKS